MLGFHCPVGSSDQPRLAAAPERSAGATDVCVQAYPHSWLTRDRRTGPRPDVARKPSSLDSTSTAVFSSNAVFSRTIRPSSHRCTSSIAQRGDVGARLTGRTHSTRTSDLARGEGFQDSRLRRGGLITGSEAQAGSCSRSGPVVDVADGVCGCIAEGGMVAVGSQNREGGVVSGTGE